MKWLIRGVLTVAVIVAGIYFLDGAACLLAPFILIIALGLIRRVR